MVTGKQTDAAPVTWARLLDREHTIAKPGFNRSRAHNQTLVTRNVKDFAPFGLSLVNPWDGG